jgi:hypothetical protein
MESLERAVAAGRSLVDLLREKTAEPEKTEMPFHHFATIAGEDFLAGHGAWHSQRFEGHSDAAETYFRDMGMTEDGEE